MRYRFDLAGLCALIVATNLFVDPAYAVPPPPPPANYVASWEGIDRLQPMLGLWKGASYRKVVRPAGRDLLLIESGKRSSDGKSDWVEHYEIITYDPIAKHYVVFMPGYRLFSDNHATGEIAEIMGTTPSSLCWSIKLDHGGVRKTCIGIRNGEWLETVDVIRPGVPIDHQESLNLTRTGDSGFSIRDSGDEGTPTGGPLR